MIDLVGDRHPPEEAQLERLSESVGEIPFHLLAIRRLQALGHALTCHEHTLPRAGRLSDGPGTTTLHSKTSPDAIAEKARFVLGVMERRMDDLGATWASTTAVQVYTVHDLYPFLASDIVARGAARHGLTWQFCRPPVIGLEYEMDCRAVATERVIEA